MKTKKLIYALLALIFLTTACKKDYYEAEDNQNNINQSAASIDELKASDSFNWKTSRDIHFNLS
ncbi:MAG: hypothetical protein K8R58_00015, partial [Bacteroidales bacterium]|nr:hypothetical protein [Bacteroidales bacterium]